MQELEHKTIDGELICYAQHKSQTVSNRPTIVWLGGFRSDMQGSKARFFHELAEKEAWPFIRFDYFGHGNSSGDFENGTISRWQKDALEVVDNLTSGPVLLLGSSMGGWIALLCAMARPKRVKGLLLIAPAPDFTQKLMWPGFDEKTRATITEQGVWYDDTPYGPLPITKKLIEDGAKMQVLDKSIPFDGPVRIVQGMLDTDVPWQHAFSLVEKLDAQDVVFQLLKDADHGCSRPKDLIRLKDNLFDLMDRLS